MGKRYPLPTRPQAEGILKGRGFKPKVTHGSHTQWEGYVKGQRRLVTVRKLSRDSDVYGPDLMASMIRQSGLSKEEFYSNL